ncbi:hypothetical protein V5O48_001702 [Marasmius crinis-equi]|uniref:DH domain-containing protein n=1 Tax=Marasmius crinis-equi TaxID=585013 RepID=A0ABR3FXR1_9AGAR
MPSDMASSTPSSAWIDSEELEQERLEYSEYPEHSQYSLQQARARHPPSHYPQIPPNPSSSFRSPALTRSASAGEPLFRSDAAVPPSFERPSKSMALPDPLQYPMPYPFHPPGHLNSSPPGLSSADSSSASTRSSAYTSFGSAMASSDDPHVHVAVPGNEESTMGLGITSDSVVQLLKGDPASPADHYSSRAPVDQTRWSAYSGGARSRSSSLANSPNGNSIQAQDPVHKLRHQPSYDMSWQTVDERDEAGVSEDETDDEGLLTEDEYDEGEEERTSAVVVAEEGRGLIVQGNSQPVSQLHIQPGTTHLLVGSSSTPNSMPNFLVNTIPQITSSLLALDISANFLGALPPCLMACRQLEELNIAFNPLRVLPVFLTELKNLRVLIADSIGTTTLPDSLVDLDKLHTISVRKNKMHALPSWLCLLPSLQALYVDGNPFQGPWKALVEPLLAKAPMTPAYPLSTPTFPLNSATTHTSDSDTDADESSDPPSASAVDNRFNIDEEHTITPERAPMLNHDSSSSISSDRDPTRPLTRTRTTPNRAFYSQTRGRSTTEVEGSPRSPNYKAAVESPQATDSGYFGDHEVRKMKSAGDLRKNQALAAPENSPLPPFKRPPLNHFATTTDAGLLNQDTQTTPPRPDMVKRYASVGPVGSLGEPSPKVHHRPPLTQSMWEGPEGGNASSANSPDSYTRADPSTQSPTPTPAEPSYISSVSSSSGTIKSRSKEGKEKNRWGFLKKMSMGKMKPDSPQRVTNGPIPRPQRMQGQGSPDASSVTPQINMRISTTGTLNAFPNHGGNIPTVVQSPPDTDEGHDSTEGLKPNASSLSSNLSAPSALLQPPSPTPRSGRRRSFLPIDGPSLNIPIPENSAFVPGMTATNDDDQQPVENQERNPSPTSEADQYLRREQERAREAYTRALRSVMAYLRDMNDLSLSQQAAQATVYGAAGEPMLSQRPRALTVGGADGLREVSIALGGDTQSQLRTANDQAQGRVRSGTSSQTTSVAASDTSQSSEERKIKDDKAQRARVAKEILDTERTYVKQLQQLVDIYVKPSSANVTILSGVGSSKETVVPASERKIVFGGLDSLFSFHKESFLPSLEIALAPLLVSSAEQEDANGQLSLGVANTIGDIFFKHVAFMKMYSTYINNFDNAVQRIKYWTSDRSANSNPSPSMSPSSSTAHLAGIGLSMGSISNPGVSADGASSAGAPSLSSSQRKRIRSFLKRCRLHPQHSQINLEAYILLPIQRIPRYKLLLEQLRRSTPQPYGYMEDPLDRALVEISSLANNMNEGKRESESRRKLVLWQSRIRGKFPSPLVQPHRRLIMDGPLLLTRVVRKAVVTFESINAQGDASTVDVDCLAPELTPRPLIGILCNDLLVLCRDPSEGREPSSFVDLWAVLRMQTLAQPASIVHGNALRLVDNKAILYFDAPSASDALNWYRAINLHIPASKT